MTAGLGVVVLTHGDGAEALPLLRSLPDEHDVPAESIVAVQNPVRPGDPDLVPPDGITVLRMTENLGYAGGMNAGMRHHLDAGADLVLILTGEVRLRPGAVERLLAAAERAPDFGALGPAIWWRSEDQPFSFGGVRLPGGKTDQRHELPARLDEGGIAECDWIEGAAMLLRAKALEQVGLLDERFFLYFEETELGLRLSRAGWRLGVVVDAVADQEPGLRRRPGAYAYLLTRNGLEYARRAAGWRGVAKGFGERSREAWHALRVLASPRSSREARAANRVLLAALRRGVVDFARRRWGPPPATLRGLGDIAGTKEPPWE